MDAVERVPIGGRGMEGIALLQFAREQHKSGLEVDHYEENPLTRIEELERKLEELERLAAMGLFDGTTMVLPGQLSLPDLSTGPLEIVDSGTATATEQGWVEVEDADGNTGYVRVYASK